MVGNLKSVDVYPHIVMDKLSKEFSEGRIASLFHSPPFLNFRISPLGVVPKKEPH